MKGGTLLGMSLAFLMLAVDALCLWFIAQRVLF